MSANSIPLDIKDDSLILSQKQIEGITQLEIKDGIYLSDVLNSLPYGIVCKDETGMGATTLELKSPRPSIIVEPLKITASSKAKKHEAIYYGSKTSQEPKPTLQEIKDRLQATPLEKRKIVVVADSLKKIKEILKEEFKEYFLMLDEADSFQIDSTFRNSMAQCLDIYKEHPVDKRALVTATPLIFSDIDLQNERTIIIKYSTPQVRNIDLIHCKNINGTAIEIIKEILLKYSNDKIAVFYNSVSGCLDIASHLVSNQSQQNENIKILCSSNSKEKAGVFFHELETDILPATINLLTSAYFTGFDLHESYHQVSISDGDNPIFLLSDKRLKQIAGRCRKKLLTETVIYSTSLSSSNCTSADEMIKAADYEKQALKCININYEKHPLLKAKLSEIRDNIINLTGDKGAQFLRQDINNKLAVNYLSIDASVEAYRVKKDLYQNKSQLLIALENDGHFVSFFSRDSNIQVNQNKGGKIDKEKQVNDIINGIVDKGIGELNDQLKDYGLGNLRRDIIVTYLNYKPYIKQEDVIIILKSFSKRDSKEINNLKIAADFLIMNDNNNYKIQVNRFIKKGESYTREKLIEKWKMIIAETGLGINSKFLTENKVMHLTKLHFNIIKKRNTPQGDPIEIKIIDINPKGFKLIRPKNDPTDPPRFYSLFS